MQTFTTAPTFSSGSDITVANHISMADAFNDRLKSGIGEGSKRIFQYIYSLVRNHRNPTEDSAFPFGAEWLESYATTTESTLPNVQAGTYNGPNVNNPMNAFIFGSGDFASEATRLDQVSLYHGTGNFKIDKWIMAANQRGAYDPNTGNGYTPALDAALSASFIKYDGRSFFGKSYGGYMPVPRLALTACWGYYCIDNASGIYAPNWQYKFTNLNTGEVETYSGRCGPDACGYTTDVAYIVYSSNYYFVVKFDGTVREYSRDEWLEGPYDGGGMLKRTTGDQIERLMLNSFVKEYRGTPEQRPSGSCWNIQDVAFNFQEFFNRNYQLAPAYATTDKSGQLVVEYPEQTLTGNYTTGQILWQRALHDGFVVGGRFLAGVELPTNVSINVYHNDTLIETIELAKCSNEYCDTYVDEYEGGLITFRAANNISLGAGYIYMSYSELLKYKPEIWDAYVVLRMASTYEENEENDDMAGYTCIESKRIYDDYDEFGGIVNLHGRVGVAPNEEVQNTNPVHEAMRRQVNDYLRLLNPDSLVGYEVSDGKSIFYFTKNNEYNENHWVGLIDENNPTTVNGIKTTAPKAGFTNEWIMELNLKNYGGDPWEETNSSIWGQNQYAKAYPYVNRALVLEQNINGKQNTDKFVHYQYTPGVGDAAPEIARIYGGTMYAPEALTVANYDKANDEIYFEPDEPAIAFYKSNQIYPKPYVVESIYQVADNMIKVTLDRRLQCHENAPASVSSNPVYWDYQALWGEEYRTEENGIMQYLLLQNFNMNANVKIGDGAYNGRLVSAVGFPHGCVYPHFFFTKLVTKPYVPDNTNSGSLDVRNTIISCDRFVQMETYLRAMCEGFVDSFSTYRCIDDPSINTSYDFTYENLCFHAFGETHIQMFSTEMREDKPICYGPLPNTVIYAETLNQISAAVNLLVSARVPLPFDMYKRYRRYVGYQTEPNRELVGNDCEEDDAAPHSAVILDVSPPTANTLYETTEWEPANNADAYSGCGWVFQPSFNRCDGDDYIVGTFRQVVDFKVNVLDWRAIYCLPQHIRELMDLGYGGVFATYYYSEGYNEAYKVYSSSDSLQSCACYEGDTYLGFWNPGTGEGYNKHVNVTDTTTCVVLTAGTLDSGTPPATDILNCRQNCGFNVSGDPGGSYRSINAIPVNTQQFVITVPLV